MHTVTCAAQRSSVQCSSTAEAATAARCARQSGLQALATACVFLATKIDSAYHRLESIVHVSYRALRELYSKPLEPEYYNPDGVRRQ